MIDRALSVKGSAAVLAAVALHAEIVGAGPESAPLPRVWSSSNENGMLLPQLAVDGNPNTRWGSSFSDNQWLIIDLGEPRVVRSLAIHWNTAAASKFSVSVSLDGVGYEPATKGDVSAGEGLHEVALERTVRARFLKSFQRAVKRDSNEFSWISTICS